jgi:uncharacterized membrane protein required for colicin V production
MGLDLALVGLVLFVAIRGWLKGFVVQAIRLAGLVAAVYAAAPVRDEVKPYLVDQLPTMRPELLDRMLWWASAVVGYFVIVGVASLIVAVSRRHTFGLAEPNRGDQFAGFGLGVLKGLVIASFVVAGLQKYGGEQIAKVDWAEAQKKESFAWMWHEQYRPAAKIWSAPPVQSFVNHIQKMGLMSLPASGKSDAAKAAVQTASRAPSLAVPAAGQPAPAPRTSRTTRKPLALKHPTAGRTSTKAKDRAPEIDTQGLDPEMAGTVESLLNKLGELESLGRSPD